MFNNTQKKINYKKQFKVSMKSLKYTTLKLGIMGIRILQSTRLLPDQMETIRRVFVRTTLRMGKIWLNTKINYLLTSKSQGSRMGKGVGSTQDWVIEAKVGQIIVEFSWVDMDMHNILLKMSKKFPVKVDFVFKEYKY